MLRASAEFLLNNELGEQYCEVVRGALESARKSGDLNLISRALFECARAGTDQGLTELVTIAENGINDLKQTANISTLPVAILTQGFCRMFFLDPAGCLRDLKKAIEENTWKSNAAEMAFIYSGIALGSFLLCRMNDSVEAYSTAFELTKQVGDDARMSVLASNICVLQAARGLYGEAIRWGERAVSLGEASKSNALQMSYSNLVDPYVLMDRENDAIACMEKAREWLGPRRRWKFHCGFLMGNASFALMQGNTALALDLIGQLEGLARGREDAVPIPGSYWKLRIFKEAQIGRMEEARQLVRKSTGLLRDHCPLFYLDVLAAKAWLEIRAYGRYIPETVRELGAFEEVGAVGRRALLIAQGFLSPSNSGATEDASQFPTTAPTSS
jgi:tetratricopeptide (TPR) repeat protein